MINGGKGIHYIGDYKPVKVMRNNIMLAGYEESEKSGTSLEWTGTYNDKVLSLLVDGKSEQTVTVDAPSPDYPSPIISTGEVSGIDLTVTGNAGQSYQVHRDMVLRSLPDGTHDTWDAVTGTVTRNVGVRSINGTETYTFINSRTGYNVFYITISGKAFVAGKTICTHFKNDGSIDNIGGLYTISDRTRNIALSFAVPTTITTVAQMQTYIASLSPVTVLYKLATPTTESISAIPLPTYPGLTRITQNTDSVMTARARVAV